MDQPSFPFTSRQPPAGASRQFSQPRPHDILGDLNPEIRQVLQQFLIDPMLELKSRPSHRFRSDLVDIGFALAAGEQASALDEQHLKICADSIEYLHLGSLIIDDIQDGSEVRRNGRALHCLLGAPHALGVGNWLYFYALRLLGELQLPPEQHATLYKFYSKTVELAHYGQIMDICVKVDALPYAHIEALCHDTSRYKTGSIVMLALVLGALVGGADAERVQCVEEFGFELGAYLQNLNDLGNFAGSFDVEKKWEDLLARKPSFVWAFVAQSYGRDAFEELQAAVKLLPTTRPLELWLQAYPLVDQAKAWVERRFAGAVNKFQERARLDSESMRPLFHLKERIQNAYV